MGRLLEFWRGTGTNQSGHTFEDVMRFNDSQLEDEHDYIQWIFPLDEASRAQPSSPVLTQADIDVLTTEPGMMLKAGFVLGLMTKFFGFDMYRNGNDFRFVRADDFDERASNWISARNHNFLRLTRMLKSMSLLNYDYYAIALQKLLLEIADDPEYKTTIGPATRKFWQEAI